MFDDNKNIELNTSPSPFLSSPPSRGFCSMQATLAKTFKTVVSINLNKFRCQNFRKDDTSILGGEELSQFLGVIFLLFPLYSS
uniref:Putative plastidic glucose transporter 2 n=1 Tax=Rhizophora mucronata TaxID=61149 RepID=A0A2P2LZD7_RHIMU